LKTTLDLDDAVLRRAKQQAAAAGISLRSYVEDALRARMMPRARASKAFQFRPPLVAGTAPPAVDVADRDLLYDVMEGRR
jgi:hypothetical protein